MKRNKHTIVLLSIFLCLFVLGSLFPLGVLHARDVSAPIITVSPDAYDPIRDILYIEGSARATSTIQIQFLRQGTRPVTATAKSDARGEWSLAQKVVLEEGEWEVRARIVEETSQLASEWSNSRVLRVHRSGVTIGGANITFSFLILIVVTLLFVGGIVLVILFMRLRRMKALLITREVREAKKVVQEGLQNLRRVLLDELRTLNGSGKTLDPEALSRKEGIFRELDQIETKIGKEVEDIEDRIAQ